MLPITLIVGNLAGGGTERVVATLANAWAERGRAVEVVVLNAPKPDVPPYPLHPDVRHGLLDAGTRRYWLKHFLKQSVGRVFVRKAARHPLRRVYAVRRWSRLLTAHLDPERNPVLLAFGLYANVAAIEAAAQLGLKCIISERNDPVRQDLEHVAFDRAQWYSRADLVTANSQAALEQMRGYVPGDRLRYVPNPLAGPLPPVAFRAHPDPFRLLIVARLERHKRHEVLFRALAGLCPDVPWRLGVLGKGGEGAALRTLSDRLGISERIDYLGFDLTPERYYADADAFVLPSAFEGQPNALLEAMQHGLPCVVSDTPALREAVAHGEDGLVVPLDDAAALREALQRLMQNAALRERLGQAARQRVEQHRLDHVLPVWEAAMADVLGTGRTAHGSRFGELVRL